MGHEDAFPPPRLSVRCRFSQGTFAGTRANGRDAPIPDAYCGEVPGTVPRIADVSRDEHIVRDVPIDAFGRRPQCLPHCRDGSSSETLHNNRHSLQSDCWSPGAGRAGSEMAFAHAVAAQRACMQRRLPAAGEPLPRLGAKRLAVLRW